jgi:sugar/nucleoside kinase (ribokinase family)
VPVDYATVGHVTVDVLADGSRHPGGSAFYSALQAARLGCRTLIVTRGVRAEIERLLAPYADELELRVIDAEQTTTLQTLRDGEHREQRMLAWAGKIASEQASFDAAIVHFAPVARETPPSFDGRTRFLGVTPQGFIRDWPRGGGRIVPCALERSLLPERCDAFVFSTNERASCAALLNRSHGKRRGEASGAISTSDANGANGALVAVTAAAAPTELHFADGAVARVAVPPVERTRDDVGAGDVFAAALFVALADGSTPAQAASLANAAAAVRIAGDGPAAIGDRAAIERRMAVAL